MPAGYNDVATGASWRISGDILRQVHEDVRRESEQYKLRIPVQAQPLGTWRDTTRPGRFGRDGNDGRVGVDAGARRDLRSTAESYSRSDLPSNRPSYADPHSAGPTFTGAARPSGFRGLSGGKRRDFEQVDTESKLGYHRPAPARKRGSVYEGVAPGYDVDRRRMLFSDAEQSSLLGEFERALEERTKEVAEKDGVIRELEDKLRAASAAKQHERRNTVPAAGYRVETGSSERATGNADRGKPAPLPTSPNRYLLGMLDRVSPRPSVETAAVPGEGGAAVLEATAGVSPRDLSSAFVKELLGDDSETDEVMLHDAVRLRARHQRAGSRRRKSDEKRRKKGSRRKQGASDDETEAAAASSRVLLAALRMGLRNDPRSADSVLDIVRSFPVPDGHGKRRDRTKSKR
ncbi:hypothetical protein DIPPA_24799 [Diplonema papillatum]|nr:hypothetical protein DIPPA_24799 [Diplonema papillatum]